MYLCVNNATRTNRHQISILLLLISLLCKVVPDVMKRSICLFLNNLYSCRFKQQNAGGTTTVFHCRTACESARMYALQAIHACIIYGNIKCLNGQFVLAPVIFRVTSAAFCNLKPDQEAYYIAEIAEGYWKQLPRDKWKQLF